MTKTFNIRAIPSANVSVYDRTPFTTGYGLYIRSAGRISLVAPKLCALFPTFPSPPPVLATTIPLLASLSLITLFIAKKKKKTVKNFNAKT